MHLDTAKVLCEGVLVLTPVSYFKYNLYCFGLRTNLEEHAKADHDTFATVTTRCIKQDDYGTNYILQVDHQRWYSRTYQI